MNFFTGGSTLRLLTKARGRSNEGIILLVILTLVLFVGVVDSRFWALGSAFNIAHDTLEILVFALAFFVVLLIGGIDVSFDAVGIFAGYVVALLAVRGYFDGNIALASSLRPRSGLASEPSMVLLPWVSDCPSLSRPSRRGVSMSASSWGSSARNGTISSLGIWHIRRHSTGPRSHGPSLGWSAPAGNSGGTAVCWALVPPLAHDVREGAICDRR